jgi:hypothetical protein
VAAAWLAAAWALAPQAGAAAGRPRGARAQLKAHATRYYVIYTDLDANSTREAVARMTAMAEEYHRRTRGFAGVIRKRMGFYLFSKEKDYYDAGATRGSAGIYDAGRGVLLAVANYGTSDRLWHVVQHEGFHQFIDKVIGGDLPIWVNEGMAEYFAHGVWTGDGFVTGVIPPYRLKRLQGHIRADRIVPFAEMLTMTHKDWSEDVRDYHGPNGKGARAGKAAQASGVSAPAGAGAEEHTAAQARVNYDQAWSMVHFLVQAENGKYRKAFSAMIKDVSRKRDWKASFEDRFGPNIEAFEKRYRDWWLARGPNPTEDLYIQAVVQTMTSFLARATAQGQKFASADALLREARRGHLKHHKDQWLPPRLLENTLLYARKWRRGWALDNTPKRPRLLLQWGATKTFTGTFSTSRGKARDVKVTVTGAG